MLCCRLIISLLTLLTVSKAMASAAKITLREDLLGPLEKLICNKNGYTPEVGWSLGIFDAQIEVQTLTPKPGFTARLQDFAKAGHVLAKKFHHLGMAYGICTDGRGWVATLPAPRSPLRKVGDLVYLSADDIGEHCSKVYLDFAAAGQSRTRKIKTNFADVRQGVKINTALFGNGTLSLTCLAKLPRRGGMVLWAMMPVGAGPGATFPGKAQLSDDAAPLPQKLIAWVNSVRGEERLPLLQSNHDEVQRISQELIQSATVLHNRDHLKRASDALKKFQGSFVGENRVKAPSAQQMAWMLWHSPRHRSLILNKNATHLAVAEIEIKKENLAVLVFAKFPTSGI